MCLGGLLPRILCHTEWKIAVTVKGSAICWARWVRAEVPKGYSGSQACLPSSVSSRGASAFPIGKKYQRGWGGERYFRHFYRCTQRSYAGSHPRCYATSYWRYIVPHTDCSLVGSERGRGNKAPASDALPKSPRQGNGMGQNSIMSLLS